MLHYFGFSSDLSSTYLAEIQLENITDIMCIEFWKLDQILSIFKSLTKLFNSWFGSIHTIDALKLKDQHNSILTWKASVNHRWNQQHSINVLVGFFFRRRFSYWSFINKLDHTLTFSALLSISDVHFLMMKGMPSGTFLAAWANSTPNKWSLPWSFLCPHWIAKVSKHFLWHASEHYGEEKKHMVWYNLTP